MLTGLYPTAPGRGAVGSALRPVVAWVHRVGRHLMSGATRQGLTARRIKPRVRIRADGWIRHVPSPFPFSPKMLVEVMLASGEVIGDHLSDYAGSYPDAWWRNQAPTGANNIRLYRIVGEPPR